MESDGQVNLEILELFDKLIDIAQTHETQWEKTKSVGRGDAFPAYHLCRNSRLVLMKAKNRFRTASAKHENPKVALQTLELLPTLITTFEMIVKQERDYGNKLYEQSRRLRGVAAKVDMLPDLSQELVGSDARSLRQGVTKFSEALGLELLEE